MGSVALQGLDQAVSWEDYSRDLEGVEFVPRINELLNNKMLLFCPSKPYLNLKRLGSCGCFRNIP